MPPKSKAAIEERFLGWVKTVSSEEVEAVLAEGNINKVPDLQVGDYVLIASKQYKLLAIVTSQKTSQVTSDSAPSSSVRLRPLVSMDVEQGQSLGGIVHSCAPGDEVYLAPPVMIGRAMGRGYNEDASKLALTLAVLGGREKVTLSFTPEQMFQRHCAVLGTSGGGKSWTLARLLEETASMPKAKVVLFDAVGEYDRLEKGVKHVTLAAKESEESNETVVSVPYYHLTEDDLFKIFRPGGQSQGPKLRTAMKSLKLAEHAKHLVTDGVIIKSYKPRAMFDEAYAKYREKVDSPLADFEIKHLCRQIENECIQPQRSATEPHIFGGLNAREHGECLPLISRIHDMIGAPSLSSIFNPGNTPSIFKELHNFLKDDNKILRISLANFSYEYHAREIIINSLGRHLLMLARRGYFRSGPLLLVVDEAHQFLKEHLADQKDVHSLNSFSLIAKEGRKYGLTMCIATQRPRDIPEGVLSQIGTLIVHRIVNDLDRTVIERACGEMDRSAAIKIPTLGPGEAIFLGIGFDLPVSVKIIPPSNKPSYDGADYQTNWGTFNSTS